MIYLRTLDEKVEQNYIPLLEVFSTQARIFSINLIGIFQEMEGESEGYIAFKQPWPGIMRTVYGDHDRFEKTYFQRFLVTAI